MRPQEAQHFQLLWAAVLSLVDDYLSEATPEQCSDQVVCLWASKGVNYVAPTCRAAHHPQLEELLRKLSSSLAESLLMHSVLGTKRIAILTADTVKVKGEYTSCVHFEPLQGIVKPAWKIGANNLGTWNCVPGFDKSRIPTESGGVERAHDKPIHKPIKRTHKVGHFQELRIGGTTIRHLIYGRVREGKKCNALSRLSLGALLEPRYNGSGLSRTRAGFNEAAASCERQFTLRVSKFHVSALRVSAEPRHHWAT
jgi:hypothetical protein